MIEVPGYSILRKLGEGGMGVVYLAHDTKLDRNVALKFLPHHLTAHQPERARFLQEAKAASALNHPNVCTIYDIKEEGEEQFIVMEYVEGTTLKEKLPIADVDEALRHAIQVAEAVHEAHERGVIHRDIKSENIMVNTKGQAKVTDFGLAKLKGSLKLTRSSSTLGTLAYMAPEQIQGSEADVRSDIFSFGALLFEMFTGHTPFRGEHEAALMYSILHDEPEQMGKSRPDVPPELERIIRRALEKNPADRYQHINELTSELRGLQKNPRSVPGEGPAPAATVKVSQKKNRVRMAFVGIFLVVLVAGAIAWFGVFGRRQSIDSIAVLPFVNVGSNADAEYLSDGITESLINTLSQLSNLTVMSRNSVFHYKGQDVDPGKVGKELGVKAILLGRVAPRGDNLQISTELVDVSNNSHLWGEQYTRKMTDILALQEEIARQISANLKLRLSGEELKKLGKRYTENTEAYQRYLRGNFFIQKTTADALAKGLDLMNQAIALDPNFALPYLGRAYYNAIATDFYIAPHAAMPEVLKDSRKALELDESIPEAHNWLGFYYLWYEFDWKKAEQEFVRSIELNPNSTIGHQYYSWLLTSTNRPEPAMQEAELAAELDPLSPEPQMFLAIVLYFARHYDEALSLARKSMELDANYPFNNLISGFCLIRQGKYDDAVGQLQRCHELFASPWTYARLAYGYAMAGRKGEARAILDSLGRTKEYVASDLLAAVYVALGDRDKAFEYLDRGYDERAGWLVWLKVDPIWDPIRSDPRFTAFLKRMNL